jgi:hypothetical protein
MGVKVRMGEDVVRNKVAIGEGLLGKGSNA